MAKIFPCKLTGLHHLGCFFLINNYVTRIIYWNRIFQIEYSEMDQYGLNGSKCSKIYNKIKQRDDGKYWRFGWNIVDSKLSNANRMMLKLGWVELCQLWPIRPAIKFTRLILSSFYFLRDQFYPIFFTLNQPWMWRPIVVLT